MAGNSPWSNGINEKNYQSCDITIKKLMEENSTISLEDALAKLINSHNLQIRKNDFSPRQVMFGCQGTIPGVTEGSPATWEPVTESDALRRDFINRQRAEELFRKIDLNERIQKTMAGQVQGYVDASYMEGELVLYKEKNSEKWTGPGKVTGVEGSKVRIIHMVHDRTVPKKDVIPFQSKQYEVEENTIPSTGLEGQARKMEDKSTSTDEMENIQLETESQYTQGLESQPRKMINTSIPAYQMEIELEAESSNRSVLPKRYQVIEFSVDGETRTGKVTWVFRQSGKEKHRRIVELLLKSW